MPKYDLSTPTAVSVAAAEAKKQAANEHNQGSYNAAWLYGYATALSDVSEQQKTYQHVVGNLLDYLAEHMDNSEIYRILHDDLEMNQDDISLLGFDLIEFETQAEPKQMDFLFLNNAFKDRGISHWSFTGLYEEERKTLRALLESGKDFDTGEGYSEDETIFLRIYAQGDKLRIMLRQELDYDDAEDFVRDLAKGDPYEEILTDEVISQLSNHYSSVTVFNEGIQERCSLPRNVSFDEVMYNIGILENIADDRMKCALGSLRSLIHEDLIAAIPDEEHDIIGVVETPLSICPDILKKPSLSDKISDASEKASGQSFAQRKAYKSEHSM